MKQKLFFPVVLFITFLFGCSNPAIIIKEVVKEVPKESVKQGFVQFSFGESNTLTPNENIIGLNKSVSSSNIDGFLVSIESDTKSICYLQKLNVYRAGDELFSEKIALDPGNYKLTTFFVIDTSRNIVYVAPKTGSQKAYLVANPLNITFTISSESKIMVIPDTVPIENYPISQFGYQGITLSKTFDLPVKLLLETPSGDIATNGKMTIETNKGVIYDNNLVAGTNTIQINDINSYYNIKFSKDGFSTTTKTFNSNSELKTFIQNNLVVENIFYNPSADVWAFKAGDVNNDGKKDVIIACNGTRETKGYIKTAISDGDGTFKLYQQTFNIFFNTNMWFTGDFNGDSKTDILYICQYSSGNTITIWSFLSNGDGTYTLGNYVFNKSVNWDGKNTIFRTGFINNDNKTDLYMIHNENAGGIPYVYSFISNGNGTFNSNTGYNTSLALNWDGIKTVWRTGDYNNDGLTDLYIVNNVNNIAKFYSIVTNGSGGFSINQLSSAWSPTWDGINTQFFVGDMNANNISDVMIIHNDNNSNILIQTTDVISSITQYKLTGWKANWFQDKWFVNHINSSYDKKTDAYIIGHNQDGAIRIHPIWSYGDGNFLGDGMGQYPTWQANWNNINTENILCDDFNGDGNSDFVFIAKVNNYISFYSALGKGFIGANCYQYPAGQSTQWIYSSLNPETDRDGDGVLNNYDNCSNTSNANQADVDGDGKGDICDNCPNTSNANQADVDGDSRGDICDNCVNTSNANQADADGDGNGDICDNCPNTSNANQADVDGDRVGDVCDNCVNTSNANQANADGDNRGDVCDNCPTVSNNDQADTDGDGKGNVCDNCPNTSNANQADADGDSRGDICDNCVNTSNANQADADGDGKGDVCDNCPNTSNANQADSDHDGIGDACDPTP